MVALNQELGFLFDSKTGEAFEHLFTVFDLDGNGSISMHEFKSIVKYLKLNNPSLLQSMQMMAAQQGASR